MGNSLFPSKKVHADRKDVAISINKGFKTDHLHWLTDEFFRTNINKIYQSQRQAAISKSDCWVIRASLLFLIELH